MIHNLSLNLNNTNTFNHHEDLFRGCHTRLESGRMIPHSSRLHATDEQPEKEKLKYRPKRNGHLINGRKIHHPHLDAIKARTALSPYLTAPQPQVEYSKATLSLMEITKFHSESNEIDIPDIQNDAIEKNFEGALRYRLEYANDFSVKQQMGVKPKRYPLSTGDTVNDLLKKDEANHAMTWTERNFPRGVPPQTVITSSTTGKFPPRSKSATSARRSTNRPGSRGREGRTGAGTGTIARAGMTTEAASASATQPAQSINDKKVVTRISSTEYFLRMLDNQKDALEDTFSLTGEIADFGYSDDNIEDNLATETDPSHEELELNQMPKDQLVDCLMKLFDAEDRRTRRGGNPTLGPKGITTSALEVFPHICSPLRKKALPRPLSSPLDYSYKLNREWPNDFSPTRPRQKAPL